MTCTTADRGYLAGMQNLKPYQFGHIGKHQPETHI